MMEGPRARPVWQAVTLAVPVISLRGVIDTLHVHSLGRCHASFKVSKGGQLLTPCEQRGSKLLLFRGSLQLGNPPSCPMYS